VELSTLFFMHKIDVLRHAPYYIIVNIRPFVTATINEHSALDKRYHARV